MKPLPSFLASVALAALATIPPGCAPPAEQLEQPAGTAASSPPAQSRPQSASNRGQSAVVI
ncbi:MAG: hypothetical protein O3A60_09145, partial [Planctomycetota bacterium]|nr:hypothetical protein [Planctomycetota bacterium]